MQVQKPQATPRSGGTDSPSRDAVGYFPGAGEAGSNRPEAGSTREDGTDSTPEAGGVSVPAGSGAEVTYFR